MKLLHQLGHNKNWNVDAHFENGIGDGFIFHAFSFAQEDIGKKLCGHAPEDYLPISYLDLQFYGGKDSAGGAFVSYPFHPVNDTGNQPTTISTLELAIAGVNFQEEKGFKSVIIPHIYNKEDDGEKTIDIIKGLSRYLKSNRKPGVKYYMTLPFGGQEIKNAERVEEILQAATEMTICFDGYYVVCEPNVETRKKISTDVSYYKNLSRVFNVLKKNNFEIIHGFANVDAVIFSTMCDIDYVSIGTYEVLRNFNIKRFTDTDPSGGPSKGWYFSDAVLNFIRAQELDLVRTLGGMSLIANKDNVFSDTILKEDYAWNTHRPDVHKNYLVAISKLLKGITDIKDKKLRAQYTLEKVLHAQDAYRDLEAKNIFLSDEASGYHLAIWRSLLTDHLSRL